jgi:uncharacterized membrane-anchored protein YitT (DUF2179 family)
MVKKAFTYFAIVLTALMCAMNYQLFVFPNQFAPAGINGVATMIQYTLGINVGYMSLLINIPLAALVFFLVSKPLAIRSMLYVVVFSVALVVLDYIDLSRFAYSTDTGTSTIMGPLVAGIIQGTAYSILFRASAYSGGTDFVAALIHKRHPEKSMFGLIFVLNSIVAAASYFVYNYRIEPVIMCILYSFTSTTVSDKLMKNGRSAVRFEIITEHPEEIADAIIHNFRHGATLIPGKGMFKGKEVSVLICVVNRPQVTALSNLVKSYPNTFVTVSQVEAVVGNFKKISISGKIEKEYLDQADGKAV